MGVARLTEGGKPGLVACADQMEIFVADDVPDEFVMAQAEREGAALGREAGRAIRQARHARMVRADG